MSADHAAVDISVIKPNSMVTDQKSTLKKNKSFVAESQASTLKKGGKTLTGLPGNNFLNEQEDRKLGVRDDRYGVFGELNQFDQVVEIEREKLQDKLRLSQSSNAQSNMNKNDQKQSKTHINDALKDISKRTGLDFYGKPE